MLTDAKLFELPDHNRITIYADGRVIFTYYPEGESYYSEEEDISNTKLGLCLRGLFLDPKLLGSLGTKLLEAVSPKDAPYLTLHT